MALPEVFDPRDFGFWIDGAMGFKGSVAVARSIFDTL